MEVSIIITLILASGLVIERLIKHVHKSKCCNSEIEFNDKASAPEFSTLLKK